MLRFSKSFALMTSAELLEAYHKQNHMVQVNPEIEETRSLDRCTLEELREEAESLPLPRKQHTREYLLIALKAEQAGRMEQLSKRNEHFTHMLRCLSEAQRALEEI